MNNILLFGNIFWAFQQIDATVLLEFVACVAIDNAVVDQQRCCRLPH